MYTGERQPGLTAGTGKVFDNLRQDSRKAAGSREASMTLQTKLGIWLVGCLMVAQLPAGAQRLDRQAMLVRGQLTRLVEDVMVLQRLVPLQLTEAQIVKLLETYEKVNDGPAEGPEAEALAKLREMKQRLLEGTLPVAADAVILRDTLRAPRAAAAPRLPEVMALSPLAQAVWDILTPEQQAVLMGAPAGAQANAQRAPREAGRHIIERLGKMRQLDETTWLAERDRLAAAIATSAGPPDSPARQNVREMMADFLNRLKGMDQATFERTREELAAEITALLPAGINVHVVIALTDPAAAQRALDAGLLHYRAPELLHEMQAARARPQ